MAIDGVAPRAKMNQQRARRFRAAQEAEQRAEVDREAREYMAAMGHKVSSKDEKSWDSNVITPGTKFMSKLAKYLRFYIRDRINNNQGWKNFKVIFSDAGVPGEGEHKLMSYIRAQRAMPGYDPNQHHVLHGLDADLIMLGLATHEVKFSILREEVLFGKAKYEAQRAKEQATILDANGIVGQKRKRGEFGEHDGSEVPDDQKPLQFLHIAVLREYLQLEFAPLGQTLQTFTYDFERIVDDFVFLCFFVGNDFLPHLPSLDIRDGALDFLIILYAKLLPALGGYLTEAGEVNLSRVDVIFAEVGSVEDTVFQRRAVKSAENERMRKTRALTNAQRDQISADVAKGTAVKIQKREPQGKNSSVNSALDEKYANLSPEEAVKLRVQEKVDEQLEKYRTEVQDVVRLGEPGWKTRYYSDKLKAEDIEQGGGRERVFQSYVEGLCWVMRYYYSGCASWQWFYPFHYAPFASDLRNIDRFSINFNLGQPFRPFEQLMGVFPAGSRHAIPKPYRWLMVDPESPIIDFYPKEIPVDPNGKAMPWLWVVLLPFIDEKRLLDAMADGNTKLTEAEMKRNERYGKELIFFHSSCPVVSKDNGFPTADNGGSVAADPSVSASFNGTLVYNTAVDFPLGCVVPSVEKQQVHLRDIPNNQCLSFEYIPPSSQIHRCCLLDGAVPSAPTLLSDSDRYIKIPFFGKANISIVDLVQGTENLTNANYQSNGRRNHGGQDRRILHAQHPGSYNQNHYNGSQYTKQYNHNGSYGTAQPYTNSNLNVNRYSQDYPASSNHSQYLTNGVGNWGSQEPRNKYGNYGGRGQSYGNMGPPPPMPYNNTYGSRNYGNSTQYPGPARGSGSRITSAFGGSLQPAEVFAPHGTRHIPPPPNPHHRVSGRSGIDSLKAGLRNMHTQRNNNNGSNEKGSRQVRYDR